MVGQGSPNPRSGRLVRLAVLRSARVGLLLCAAAALFLATDSAAQRPLLRVAERNTEPPAQSGADRQPDRGGEPNVDRPTRLPSRPTADGSKDRIAETPGDHSVQRGATVDLLRLRIAWGGGASRIWEAKLSLSEGQFGETRLLGLEADASGSLVKQPQTLWVRPAMPRSYDGLDVSLSAPLTASLTVEISAPGDARTAQRIVLPLSKLVDDTSETPLDAQRNKLVIRRAPGDRLRVRTTRSHLVFDPGEKFTLDVQPHLITLAPGELIQAEIQLVRARSDEELWRSDRDLLVAPDGALPAIGPLDVDLPKVEGAFDLVVTLRRPPKNRFLGQKSTLVAQRRMQVVVVDPAPPAPAAAPWQVVAEIDPANPKWWDRLTRLPTWKMLPGLAKGPLESGKISRRSLADRSFTQLEPQAWQAFPLAVSRPGVPHVLEVEVPAGVGQTLGISLVEPNAAGLVMPVGLDSGLEVADDPLALTRPPHWHRLVFWPKTSSPLLVLTNRRDDRPALFGRFRVAAGPDQLPGSAVARDPQQRLAVACFDRPLFAQNFSATDALDPGASRNLDDWQTFLEGATRLAQYLRYGGYNAAVLPVLHEGGSLYPSREIDATARHDTGVYFSTGQDPMQKDVLELLLRVFDREGLRLIPALQLASPLGTVESLRLGSGETPPGLELIDAQGMTWSQRNGGRRALGPIYNPLDPRVQTAIRQVTLELTDRYRRHPALAGVALQMGPETFAQLPGPEWGFDPVTLARFQKETGVTLPNPIRDQETARAAVLLGAAQDSWLAWRAANLAAFHRELAAQIAPPQRPDLRLFLATGDALDSPSLLERLKPALPRRGGLADALVSVGIDVNLYRDASQIVVLRPQTVSPQGSLARLAASAQQFEDPQLEAGFTSAAVRGAAFRHQPLTLRLASFEQQSPFGPDKTNAYFVAQISPAGPAARQHLAHAVAQLDPTVLCEGGWLLPLGQEAESSPLLEAFRQLPAASFHAAPPAGGSSPLALVRTYANEKKSWLYAVNDSPWPVTVDIRLTGPERLIATPLAGRAAPPLAADESGYLWRLTLEPYDLLAAEFPDPGVTVSEYSVIVAPHAVEDIRQRLRAVRERAAVLREPSPLPSIANASFELPMRGLEITGWTSKRSAGLSAQSEPTTQAYSGKQALHLTSDRDVLWVRSAPFAQPRTGRLALKVFLRVDDEKDQPPLRLAIEGRSGGQSYYRFATVGAGGTAPLGTQWMPFVFQVDDLPPGGLSDLRVGFDLMGTGAVWIDDVQIYDLWFFKSERDELFKLIALADFQLSQGQLPACQRFLESYWPQFLLAHVPLKEPHLASAPDRPRMSLPLEPASPDGEKPPTLLDRMRGLIPRVPSFY